MKKMDLTGEKYGRWTVLYEGEPHYTKSNRKKRAWVCRCECGTISKIVQDSLRSGYSQSCGCLQSEIVKKNFTKHGYSNHRLYTSVWHAMIERCYNKNSKRYNDYGGRGIIVCDEWVNNPESFVEWALKEIKNTKDYEETYSLDRIDVNGNYEPSNCRFASLRTQSLNKRVNNKFGYNGVSKRKSGKFVARISIDGKTIFIGTFSSVIEAAEARQLYELDVFKEVPYNTKIATQKVLDKLKEYNLDESNYDLSNFD